MHFGSVEGPRVIEWNPVNVPIDVPKDTTLAGLADAITGGIANAALEVVRELLKQPDKVALFFAITFGEKGGAYALDLLCRRFPVPGGFAPHLPTGSCVGRSGVDWTRDRRAAGLSPAVSLLAWHSSRTSPTAEKQGGRRL
jgi:hypothetical protein